MSRWLSQQKTPANRASIPAGVELLREAPQRAEAGDVDWLKSHGKVYTAVEAA
jgi:hypothetical protein